MNKIVKKIIIVLSLIALTACASSKKDIQEESPPPEELFTLGMNNFDAGKYKKAKEYFSKINLEYPYSPHAPKAQYLEGLSEYRLKKYELAAIALDEYIELYPAGEDIENSYYLKAVCFYDQIIEIRLDQEIAEKSLTAFKEVISRFPKGDFAQDSLLKIDLINDQLAGREMTIGRFYLKKNILIGAINRFKNIVEQYSQTAYIEEALYRIVESYYILGLNEEATKYAAILGTNYPTGEWYKRSYKIVHKNDK